MPFRNAKARRRADQRPDTLICGCANTAEQAPCAYRAPHLRNDARSELQASPARYQTPSGRRASAATRAARRRHVSSVGTPVRERLARDPEFGAWREDVRAEERAGGSGQQPESSVTEDKSSARLVLTPQHLAIQIELSHQCQRVRRVVQKPVRARLDQIAAVARRAEISADSVRGFEDDDVVAGRRQKAMRAREAGETGPDDCYARHGSTITRCERRPACRPSPSRADAGRTPSRRSARRVGRGP